MNNTLVWRPKITVSDATQRRLWENLRDLRDVSQETSLINLPGDVSKIWKLALFEMYLRRSMRRLRNASEMHPCSLEYWLTFPEVKAMKFGHVIEYNMGNIFCEKSYTKCGGETIRRPRYKNSKLYIIWINSLKFHRICFYSMRSWGLLKYIETKL